MLTEEYIRRRKLAIACAKSMASHDVLVKLWESTIEIIRKHGGEITDSGIDMIDIDIPSEKEAEVLWDIIRLIAED